MSFVVAGFEKVEHMNQGYKYIVTESLLKVYDIEIPKDE